MSEEKNFILVYFEKFQSKKNYSKLYPKLEEYSRKDDKKEIVIGKHTIPDISPSRKLLLFHLLLNEEDGWSEEEKLEVKKYCEIYFGETYKNDDECLFMIVNLLSTDMHKDNKDLKNIKNHLEGREDLNFDSIFNLFSSGDYLLSTISFYVINLTLT